MDNAVGRLTQFQRSLIVGTILGDGYVRIVPGRKNAFLEINHSYSQREYVKWKYEMLKNIVRGMPKLRRGNGKRLAYRFYTRALPEITELYQNFYQSGTKIVPLLKLDSVILAIWYMDDGSRCRSSDVYLNTQQFSIADQEKILKMLDDIGLKASLNRDKTYWRIRFKKISIPLLIEKIQPYIIPSMYYKIGLKPVETTRQSPDLIGMKT
ncbi:MAG: hypothetical protein G01um101417_464 [Parcubacteria group bacterium Gr01-1014_17]|nr:MAG: hypothetical protein G01um101417_464 [Parcubacteria group bacterium Gr01-1014_17]